MIFQKPLLLLATGLLLIVSNCNNNPTKPNDNGPNTPPRILSLSAAPDTVIAPAYNMIICRAVDDENDQLSYNWGYASGGTFTTPTGDNNNDTVYYQPAPCCSGPQLIKCIVTDGRGGTATDSITIFTNVF